MQALERKRPDVADWFYLPTWQVTGERQRGAGDKSALTSGAQWLVFVDSQGIGAGIVPRLERLGARVTRVYAQARSARLAENQYELDPADPVAYRHLLRSLPRMPDTILHLWSLDPPPMDAPLAAFAHAQRLGYYSVLWLIQAIDRYVEQLSIQVVTANALPVTGRETLSPGSTTVHGLCRVIPQEHPHIRCRMIDVDLPIAPGAQVDGLANQLLSECTEESDDVVIAYRGTQRCVERFTSVRIERPDRSVIRPDGVYLLVGGLGEIGLIVACYLARSGAKVILTTRPPFPEREAWPGWLASHPANDPVSGRIRALRELDGLADVLVIEADAADEHRMREVIGLIDARFGALHGVIYLAGVTSHWTLAPVEELTPEQCEAHFRPKVCGLDVLHRTLTDRRLDFCLLFSSLSSVLGGLTFGAYAAANASMDCFTHWHNHLSPQRWTSVNWDGWRTRPPRHRSRPGAVVDLAMAPEEGLDALERVLASDALTQLVTSTGDLEARLDRWVRRKSRAR
jgi:NAD(P)-dependent dehydrogenase (short-subunit alcohol dehydrogenase family)